MYYLNTAAIFFLGHPYIESTAVLSDTRFVLFSFDSACIMLYLTPITHDTFYQTYTSPNNYCCYISIRRGAIIMNLKGTHYTCFGCIAPPDSRIIIRTDL